MKKKIH